MNFPDRELDISCEASTWKGQSNHTTMAAVNWDPIEQITEQNRTSKIWELALSASSNPWWTEESSEGGRLRFCTLQVYLGTALLGLGSHDNMEYVS